RRRGLTPAGRMPAAGGPARVATPPCAIRVRSPGPRPDPPPSDEESASVAPDDAPPRTCRILGPVGQFRDAACGVEKGTYDGRREPSSSRGGHRDESRDHTVARTWCSKEGDLIIRPGVPEGDRQPPQKLQR